jgi:integrase
VFVGTPKTHEQRSVPFPEFLEELLAKAIDGKGHDDLVFSRDDGTHMLRPKPKTPTNSGGWFESAVRHANIPRVTPHDLRHTAASLAVSAGANVKVVQKMLGHKSAAMTLDVYADLFDTDLDTVAHRLNDARRQALATAA